MIVGKFSEFFGTMSLLEFANKRIVTNCWNSRDFELRYNDLLSSGFREYCRVFEIRLSVSLILQKIIIGYFFIGGSLVGCRVLKILFTVELFSRWF